MWEYRPSALAATDLLALFRDVLEACAVCDDETVSVYGDSHSPEHYAAAFTTAAQDLGAVAFQLRVPANQPPVEVGVILEAFRGADLIVDLASHGGSNSRPLRTEAMKAGTRILRVTEPEDVLFRMPPDPAVRDRVKHVEALVARAGAVQISSRGGTQLTVVKRGRTAFGLWGVVDSPGRWDHWPMGLVVVGANCEGTDGTLVIQPGDILLGMGRYAASTVTVSVRNGAITAIDGTVDAELLRQWFEQWGDERAYRIAHVGWGCDHRALWDRFGRKAEGGADDVESFYGAMQIAFGRDTSFLGGTNDVASHIDINCLRHDIALDGEPILVNGEFVPEALRR